MLLLTATFIISCSEKDKSDLQKPLVLKDGLLYKDSISTKPFSGRNKSKMLDMFIEYDVVNGIKEGDFIVYFPNKKIQMIGKMKANKNTGLWKYYFKSGVLQTSGYFNDDKPDSIWSWYNEKGILIEEGSFLKGKRNSEWRSFDTLGSLQVIKIFKDDLLIDSIRIN